MAADYVRIQGFNTLTARILDESEFRKSYKRLLEKTLQSLFTIEYMEPKIMAMYERIRPFILMDPYKKNDVERFDREPDVICEYIKNRSQYLKNNLSIL